MSPVATVIFLLFSGMNLLSAQPFFGGPGFDGFPRGPFGGDLGPRTFGIGGDFGPPTIRRLGGRFPEFGADFGGIGGGIRGGGPLLGGVDGQRFGFNGDNALGVGGPRFDVLRRGRFGFDDTTLGTGFGRRVGGGGLGTRFIPGERLGAGGFGAGNAIAPRRLGTTRTITRGNALDVPRSTVLGGLGTDSAGSFTDPITGRRVRVLSNNDASTVVSRRATGTAGGATRTGTITTRRVDPVVTATRTRLPTTLTQRGTLLRRPLGAGRRTPITRLGGTTVTRPGTLAGTAGTGLGTISNSANVDVSAIPPSSDGVPVSGFVSDQSGQGGRGNVETELVSILPGSDPLLDMQKGSLQRYLQVNEDQRRQLQGTGRDSVIVEGKSFIDWSLFNKVLREEGLLLSNETSETSSHNDIVDARRTLQDLVDGRTSFQQLNQTFVGPGNNAQQGALGSFGQSSVPQGMSMVPGAGRGMDQQMGGMTSFIGGGGPQRTGTSNIGARAVSGVPSINSNRLTFDSVDLSAFGGQTGFGADPTGQLTG